MAKARKRKPPKSAQELLKRYNAGERDFSFANLRGAMLRDADLRDADLRDADLFEANLRNANLRKASLLNASLGSASLSSADLRGATLDSAHLSRADLSSANLREASLNDAYLFEANLCKAKLRKARLSDANLFRANLREADLSGVEFYFANLSGANLSGAMLSGAMLSGANLDDADLRYADLREADLSSANLFCTNLGGVMLGGATIGHTHLLNVDISPFCDASPSVQQGNPSTVDYRSIVLSLHSPNLKDFLQRTGMPEVFIEYMVDCARSLQTDVFKMLQSTFISYGGPDEPFARKLYEALHRNGVTTFFFAEHAEPGKKLHRTMHEGVNKHDRMILVCSRASLDRKGVLNELEKVLEREARDGGASYLIPIRLDDYVFTEWKPPSADLADAVRARVVADFEGADTDDAKFNEGLRRLIAALKKPDPPKPGA